MIESKKRTNGFVIDIIFILICLTTVLPFFLLLSVSLSNEKQVLIDGYKLIPKSIDFSAYRYIFTNSYAIINAYKVTAFTSIAGTALSVMLMSLVAYPLSITTYKYRRTISLYLFFTMIFNGGMVGSYILNTQYLHLNDTLWIYILPTLINVWHVILLRTFFQGIPTEMIESAKIDGAGHYRVLLTMVMPLSKPVLATVALFGLLTRWNDWFTAMLFITDNKLVTIQYLLQKMMLNVQEIQSMQQSSLTISASEVPSETVRMGMAVVVAGPMIFVFPFFQKYFTRGLTVGSVKG